MKNSIILFMSLLFFATTIVAQNINAELDPDEEDGPINGLFQDGTSLVNLIPNIQYQRMKYNTEYRQTLPDLPFVNENEYVDSYTAIQYRANYFIWNGLGPVLGVYVDNFCQTYEGSDPTYNNTFVFEVGAQYGLYLGDFPLRAEATVGFGNYKLGQKDNLSEASVLAYNFNISSYLRVGNNGSYLSPTFGYAGFKNEFEGADFTNQTGGFVLGGTLVKNFGCGDFNCGINNYNEGYYKKGTHITQFLQAGGLGFGNNTRTLGDQSTEDGLFGYALNLSDNYYLVDNLAVSGGVQLNGLITDSKERDNKQSTADLALMAGVRGHLPVSNPLNHLYAHGQLGYQFMADNSKESGQNSSFDTKDNTNGFCWNLGFGYNWPFSDRLSLVGQLNYGTTSATQNVNNMNTNFGITSESKSETEINSANFEAQLGLALRFFGDD